jgi:hypothetical protein
MCLWACDKFVATQLLKDDSLKLMQLNQYLPFEPHEPHVILIEYEMYLRLFIYYLDKNPGWVTDGNGYAKFLEEY